MMISVVTNDDIVQDQVTVLTEDNPVTVFMKFMQVHKLTLETKDGNKVSYTRLDDD